MKGYDVRTIDGDKIGHVVDTEDDFLIVEHGLLKSKRALPKTFAEVDEEGHVVRTTLSKDLIYGSPKINGELDRIAVAEHYGLAEGFTDAPTRGLGDEPDENAYAADGPVREENEARREVVANDGPFDDPPFLPGGASGHRESDYDGD
jgi:hypothetical protein